MDLDWLEENMSAASIAALEIWSKRVNKDRRCEILGEVATLLFRATPEMLLAAGQRLAHRHDPRIWAEDTLRDIEDLLDAVRDAAQVLEKCGVHDDPALFNGRRVRKAANIVFERYRELNRAMRIGAVEMQEDGWLVTYYDLAKISGLKPQTIKNRMSGDENSPQVVDTHGGQSLFQFAEVYEWWKTARFSKSLPPMQEAKDRLNRA